MGRSKLMSQQDLILKCREGFIRRAQRRKQPSASLRKDRSRVRSQAREQKTNCLTYLIEKMALGRILGKRTAGLKSLNLRDLVSKKAKWPTALRHSRAETRGLADGAKKEGGPQRLRRLAGGGEAELTAGCHDVLAARDPNEGVPLWK